MNDGPRSDGPRSDRNVCGPVNSQTLDGKQKIKPPSGVLSTAECISLLGGSMALAGHFGSGTVADRDIAAGLHGAVVKEDSKDVAAWTEYLENIVKKRGADWTPLYRACTELLPGRGGKDAKDKA